MIHPLPPGQSWYRVTILGRRWRDVLSGRGALYLSATGNRYNTVLQQAAYVSDDPAVAVTEFAWYAARDWQDRLGNHHVLPVPGPLQSDYVLWKFRLDQPTYVIDVEHAAGVPWTVPPYVLFNPGRNHAATQHLANQAVAWPFPGHPNPHPGLRVPAVRSRHVPPDTHVNYVLYRFSPAVPRGHLEGRWRLSTGPARGSSCSPPRAGGHRPRCRRDTLSRPGIRSTSNTHERRPPTGGLVSAGTKMSPATAQGAAKVGPNGWHPEASIIVSLPPWLRAWEPWNTDPRFSQEHQLLRVSLRPTAVDGTDARNRCRALPRGAVNSSGTPTSSDGTRNPSDGIRGVCTAGGREWACILQRTLYSKVHWTACVATRDGPQW
jgi:hypothetical protein